MPRINKQKMQKLIDRTVEASNAFQQAQRLLSEECLRVYGVEPGDVDCDVVIDAVLGGCGLSPGMSADAFDVAMRACITRTFGE